MLYWYITKIDKKLRQKIKKDNMEECCSNLVKGCKKLLNKLNIGVNGPYCKQEYIRKKDGKTRHIHSWSIQIQGKENVKRFKKLVNFSIPKKSKRIDKILNNYTEIGYKISFEDSLKRVKKFSEQNKIINTKNLMKNRTVLIIAHRLSSVVSANQIVLLNEGSIVDTGNHEELMERSDRYRHLYKLQFAI